MCTCASCSYTDKYAGKGFAEWPRGEPAGPRASAGAYAAHVRHSFMGVKMRAEVDRREWRRVVWGAEGNDAR
jgi:hypothetical protein